MRLAEFLFTDPGTPPQPDHGYSTMAVDGEGPNGLESRVEHPSEYGYGGVWSIAALDGQPVDFLARGYTQEQAMRYRHMLGEAKQYAVKDKVGNKLPVEVEHDTEGGYYVASVRGGRYRRMASGAERQPIRAVASGKTPDAAVKALGKKVLAEDKRPRAREQQGSTPGQYTFEGGMARKCKCGHELGEHTGERITGRGGKKEQPCLEMGCACVCFKAVRRPRKKKNESISGHSVQTLSEVLKKGVQSQSAGDNNAIKRLTDGKYPAKAEDGKGFCFQWADGRGICAFKWRNDALRWAKAEPRDIVKFWYGEPVHSNGKFRIRVTDRYRKEEAEESGGLVETFSDLLERRV